MAYNFLIFLIEMNWYVLVFLSSIKLLALGIPV